MSDRAQAALDHLGDLQRLATEIERLREENDRVWTVAKDHGREIERLREDVLIVCEPCLGTGERHLPAFPDPAPDPNDDSIDYAMGFARMTEALLPYWERQESMRPDDALRKLVNEHQLYYDVLSDIADRVNAHEPYSDWAARVLGRESSASDYTSPTTEEDS